MNTDTNFQSTSQEPDAAQIAEAAAAKMDELQERRADVQERFTAIKYDSRQSALMPALIDDALALDDELRQVLLSYEKSQQ